ncbi:MAG: hypothetical protein JXA18_00740 [Chitinispirillaceae bacterium]|nr:hypothetical protein [Chitinispirillaceae bacterium]
MNAPAPIPLRAGPIRLLFDHGMLCSVYYGTVEVVRRIYMALRDQHWNTIPYSIDNLSVERSNASFSLSFDARHDAAGIVFFWHGAFEGTAEGVVTVTMHGEAKSTFLRNRIGWCVLHPLTLCKGLHCTLEKYVGSTEKARFPGNVISPHPTFVGLRGMSYPVESEVNCSLRFMGDIFETEDQRNWTDASFKTYSTPHSLPIPVEVTAGKRLDQQVTISLVGAAKTTKAKPAAPVIDFKNSFIGDTRPPRLGLGCSLQKPLQRDVTEKLSASGLSHLRFDVNPHRNDLDAELSRVASVCGRIGCEAEVALHLTAGFQKELADFTATLRVCDVPLCRLLVLRIDGTVPPPEMIDTAHRRLAGLIGEASITLATGRSFVEINRALPLNGFYGALCFPATPQVHTFDDRAVMENLEGLWECISFARTVANRKPIVVSPLTLRPRKDPARPQKNGGADPRQQELFGAAWLTGVLCVCIQSELHSLTCFSDVAGPEGIISDDGTEQFPLFHVLSSGITDAASVSACMTAGEGPAVAAVKAHTVSGYVLLLSNMTGTTTALTLTGLPGNGSIARLDASTVLRARLETSFWEKTRQPLVPATPGGEYAVALQPYGVTRIELPS